MAESIDPRLLEVIACPQCRGGLALDGERLICRKCALAYPIQGGIPLLLIEQALSI